MCAGPPKKGEPLSAAMASSSLSGLDQETLAELLKSAMDQGAVRVESSSPASAGIPGPFAALAAVCHRFSEELAHDASVPFPAVLRESVKENLKIIETVFAKWSLDILMITYLSKAVGFQELKGSLGSISSRVLSVRLRQLEALGLLRREGINEHPPRTRDSLTPDCPTLAQLRGALPAFLRTPASP